VGVADVVVVSRSEGVALTCKDWILEKYKFLYNFDCGEEEHGHAGCGYGLGG
jgi:hypothetical protein